MAHFAKVLNNKVIKVIVAEPEFFDTFVDDSPGQWIQTSYNTRGGVHYNPETGEPSEDQTKALRKNFAFSGCNYDDQHDAFYAVQPYPSWTLNLETFYWEPPIPTPEGTGFVWNEETQSWIIP